MPLLRGRAPTSTATSASPKASCGSELVRMLDTRGKAQSSSSITTPFKAPMAAGTSKRRKATGCCGPSIKPLATLKRRL